MDYNHQYSLNTFLEWLSAFDNIITIIIIIQRCFYGMFNSIPMRFLDAGVL